jgi:hypothetical protein
MERFSIIGMVALMMVAGGCGGIEPTAPAAMSLAGANEAADTVAAWIDPVCGDVNGNGFIDYGDIMLLLNYLYESGPAPRSLVAADVTCDGSVNAVDAVYLKNFLFEHGPAPCRNCPCGDPVTYDDAR